jgi:L-cysteate sulfo-lyase
VTDSAQLHARLARFRPVDLAHLPTPLEPMERLSKYLGGPSLWVKRDHCTVSGSEATKCGSLATCRCQSEALQPVFVRT